MKKTILAILLSLSMSFSCIPIYAEEADSTIATSVEDIENSESNETNYNEFTAFPDERIVKVPWGGEKTDITDPDIGPEVPDPGTEPEVPDSDTVWQRVVNLIQEYPDTTPWDTDMYYEWKGGIDSGGYGNEAFAYMVSDAIFGNLPARRVEDNIELRNVHPGDILRIENDTRSVIVSETYADWI